MVLGATVDKVVITDLRDKTFYAELYLTVNGKEEIVSCRPSDAMAIAARTGSPIFAARDVVESAGFIPEPDEDEAGADGEEGEVAEEVLDEFREFIDNINPEDFGG